MEDSYPSYDVPDDHSWDEPVTDLKLLNLSDDQYLSRILGPRRMGLEVGGLTALQHLMFTIFDPDCCPNDCGGFYIQFRQSFAKETFSYDEHLKS